MKKNASHIARQLHLNRSTVARWLKGDTFPTGLSAEMLQAKFPELYKELEDGYKKRRACDQEPNTSVEQLGRDDQSNRTTDLTNNR